MTVYVDSQKLKFRRMVMCHMIADTPRELHDMAKRIGMRREWFQEKASFPHYDVCLSRRAKAIQFGAVELERRDFVFQMRRIRASGNWPQRERCYGKK